MEEDIQKPTVKAGCGGGRTEHKYHCSAAGSKCTQETWLGARTGAPPHVSGPKRCLWILLTTYLKNKQRLVY